MSPSPAALEALEARWRAAWVPALTCWSKFTRLSPPRFFTDSRAADAAGAAGNFAAILLTDHAILIDLRRVIEFGVADFPLEILAHEVGHHVLAPANLRDYGRGMARVRRALVGVEQHAPYVLNLYFDLLVNDRLHRSHGLDMAGVYAALESTAAARDARSTKSREPPAPTRLWTVFMRAYEHLWRAPRGTLARAPYDEALDADAALAGRIVRVFARDWVDGVGRFAALAYPYLVADTKDARARREMRGFLDTEQAGAGGDPGELAEIEDGEVTGDAHPRLDPALMGLDGEGAGRDPKPGARDSSGRDARARGHETGPSREGRHRGPVEYGELLRSLGVALDPEGMAARYYTERARPYLIKYPSRVLPSATDPSPEGTEAWDPGSPIERIDWLATVLQSPRVIPGVTTRQRTFADMPGAEPTRDVPDLYVGIDCSGSMPNAKLRESFPVIAGTIVALSALRAGAGVKVVLSGEPGSSVSTRGFVRDADDALRVLTSYLGTGYAFGIHRLGEIFADDARPRARRKPVHVLVLTDNDVFRLLNEKLEGRLGWDVAKAAIAGARGGATIVLHVSHGGADHAQVKQLEAVGFTVERVYDQAGLVEFARKFARRTFEREGPAKPAPGSTKKP